MLTIADGRIIEAMSDQRQMKFSTRMLMVITPIGMAIGIYEAWQLAGGLVAVVAGQLMLMSLAGLALVRIMRRERQQ